jgi:hypothetical protein
MNSTAKAGHELPQFDRTLAFYEREGFAISGGRKLKVSL